MLAVGDLVKVRRVVLDERTTLGTRMLLMLSLGGLGYVLSIAKSERNPVMVEFCDEHEPRTMTFMIYELVKVLPTSIGVSHAYQQDFPLQ